MERCRRSEVRVAEGKERWLMSGRRGWVRFSREGEIWRASCSASVKWIASCFPLRSYQIEASLVNQTFFFRSEEEQKLDNYLRCEKTARKLSDLEHVLVYVLKN